MENLNNNARTTKWLMVAGLAVAGLTLNVAGCSSSDNTPATGTGGTTGGTGGHTGTGGSVVDSGVVHLVNYTFDTGLQTWGLSTYADPGGHNLAGAYTMDGGVDAAPVPVDAGAGFVAPTLTFDSAVGSPSPGSLKMTATFTAYNQYVDAIVNLTPTTTIDLTGKTLHASLQLTSGTFSGGAQLHVGTGIGYDGYGQANITLAASGTFATVAYVLMPGGPTNMSANAAFDPSKVIQMGVQVYSGAPVADAGTYVNAGVPVVFNIDTFTD